MKKLYQKLFGSEDPKIAVSFMCIIYLAAHFFIKFAFNAKEKVFFNTTYFTVDCPTSIIYQLEKVEWLQWATLIIAIAGYAYLVIKNAGLGYGEGDKTFGRFFIIGGLVVISGFLPAIFAQNKEKYRKTLDEKTFQYYKANPDKVGEIFK